MTKPLYYIVLQQQVWADRYGGSYTQYAAYFQAGSPEAAALLELGDKNTSDIGYAAKDSAVYQSQNTTHVVWQE